MTTDDRARWNPDPERKKLLTLYGLACSVVPAGVWLTVVPMLWRALHDSQGMSTVESAVTAVGLCVAPCAPLGILVAVHDSLRLRGSAAALWLAFGHLLIAAAVVGFLVPPHGVALAVLFGGLVFIPEAVTVALLRLVLATA
ncbi:hypothetical protein [Streptomyces naphthomycinicus]|uniref:hypothetical protein n=1 Tax=Streptomyces naphthomycinicus TaxID=2872625 RepID=UPI001CEC9714|nr:hypothetical protein [Streptomyces sp. TML10]